MLCDLEQVIPLMPGAQLTGHEGDDYLGKVKVKVGPVTSEFSGKVRFVEQDRDQHRAVIDAKGKEARGTGNAAATVTAQLHEDGERTSVSVDTDLKIVGKLAQFGSGMLQQVSEKLLGQFVESLEAKLAAENDGGPAGPADPGKDARAAEQARPGRNPLPDRATRPSHPSRSPSTCWSSPVADQLKKYGSVAAAALAVAGADLGAATETLAAREHPIAVARRRSGGVRGRPGCAPAQRGSLGIRQWPRRVSCRRCSSWCRTPRSALYWAARLTLVNRMEDLGAFDAVLREVVRECPTRRHASPESRCRSPVPRRPQRPRRASCSPRQPI